MGLRPKNTSLGAVGGWALLSLRHHQHQHSQAHVSKPICTPMPAQNPSGTWRLRHSITRGCQGSLEKPGAAPQLVPPHLLLLRQMGSRQVVWAWGPLCGQHLVWEATAVPGGWNLWDCGPGISEDDASSQGCGQQ